VQQATIILANAVATCTPDHSRHSNQSTCHVMAKMKRQSVSMKTKLNALNCKVKCITETKCTRYGLSITLLRLKVTVITTFTLNFFLCCSGPLRHCRCCRPTITNGRPSNGIPSAVHCTLCCVQRER